MTKISDERLVEMLAGLEILKHGPWFTSIADGRNGVAGLAQIDNGAEMWPVIAEWPEAAHIARCDPDTIRSIITELQQLRAHNSDSAEPVGVVVATGSDPDVVWYEGPELSIGAELYLASPPAKEVETRIQSLEEALRPFAEASDRYNEMWSNSTGGQAHVEGEDEDMVSYLGALGDYFDMAPLSAFRAARKALTNRTPDDGVGNE